MLLGTYYENASVFRLGCIISRWKSFDKQVVQERRRGENGEEKRKMEKREERGEEENGENKGSKVEDVKN